MITGFTTIDLPLRDCKMRSTAQTVHFDLHKSAGPCGHSVVIVGATTPTASTLLGQILPWTIGTGIGTIDLQAPGTIILSTVYGLPRSTDNQLLPTEPSQACPHVLCV